MRSRLLAALAVAGAAVVAPAVGGAPDAACAAEGQVRVAVVVDFGGAPDAPASAPVWTCVEVDDRATGADVLAGRAEILGTPPPRYEDGFLCAIDGFPASGCAERSGDGYRYWAYWHGEGDGWAFSPVGAGSRRVRDGDVEGWSFQSGTNEGDSVPPRRAPDPCPLDPPATAPPSTSAPRPGPAPTTVAEGRLPPAAPTTTATGAAGVPTTMATTPGATAATTGGRDDVAVPAAAGDDDDDDDDDGNGGAPVALAAGLGGALVLAVAAGLRFRR